MLTWLLPFPGHDVWLEHCRPHRECRWWRRGWRQCRGALCRSRSESSCWVTSRGSCRWPRCRTWWLDQFCGEEQEEEDHLDQEHDLLHQPRAGRLALTIYKTVSWPASSGCWSPDTWSSALVQEVWGSVEDPPHHPPLWSPGWVCNLLRDVCTRCSCSGDTWWFFVFWCLVHAMLALAPVFQHLLPPMFFITRDCFGELLALVSQPLCFFSFKLLIDRCGLMDQLNEICQSEREDWKLKEISEHIKCFNDTEQLEWSAPGLRVVSNSGKCIFYLV